MVNLDDFKYGGTNLTAFRLLDPDREEVKQVVQDWIFGEMRYGRKLEAHEQTIKVSYLFFSGIRIFFYVHHFFSLSVSILVHTPFLKTVIISVIFITAMLLII